MLFAVTLTYLTQHDVISAHLDAHKRWLARGLSERRIIFAGPLSNGTGGYILFHGDKVSDIHNFLKDDPCAQDFPARWADEARFM